MTDHTLRPLPTRIAFALLWAFVFALPFAQMTEFPALGMISKALGAVALLGGVVAVVVNRSARLPGTVHLAMAGFILWSAVTLCWSVAPELTVQRILTYLQLFVLVLLIWELCREEKDVLRILGAFVLGTIVPALATVIAFLPGQQTLYARAAAGVDPNDLAFLLALSLPVAYYLILREKTATSSLYRLQMGFAVVAVLMSGSAATLIAMAVGLSLMCWTAHFIPARTRVNAFVLIMLLGGVLILFIPTSVWQHLSQASRNGDITLTAIMDKGAQSLHTTPLGGLGAGASHNAPFAIFSETGIVGIAFFVVVAGVLFLSAESLAGVTKSFWLTVLAVSLVGACALNWECSQPAWLLFGLLAAHSSSLRQEGVTEAEQKQKRNYYIEQIAEVWS